MKLKPCPFCGGKAKEGIDYGLYSQESLACGCEICGCRTKIYTNKEQAISAWNRRIKNVKSSCS